LQLFHLLLSLAFCLFFFRARFFALYRAFSCSLLLLSLPFASALAACGFFSDALSLAVGWGRRIFVVLLYSNRDSDFCKGKKEDSSERLLCA
jgi:hypothetical protein